MTKRIARRIGLNLIFTFCFAMVVLTHQSANANDVLGPDHVDRSAMALNVPTWTSHDAKRFRNCHDVRFDTRPASELVVVNNAGRRYREQFSVAWDANHDLNRVNDLWVIGVCH